MKTCTVCKQSKPLSDFNTDNGSKDRKTSQCKECRREMWRKYHAKNKDKIKKYNESKKKERRAYYQSEKGKISSRRSHLKSRFNITLEEYNELLISQDYKCKICGQKHMDKRYKYLAVDHDHNTGKIRGLLCGNCNLALGNLKDNVNLLKNAIKYLENEK